MKNTPTANSTNRTRKSAHRLLAGSIVALLATTLTTDSAKAASYGIDFMGYYGGAGSNSTTPLPDNNPFGPTGAVQNNWNQLNWGTTVNQGGGSKDFTIKNDAVANPITLTVAMHNAGGNDGNGGGATNIAALYSTGLRDNDGVITLTTTVAPYSKYDLYQYYGSNSNGGNFTLNTNYTVTTNLTGPLNFTIGQLNGFSIVEVPQHRWVGGTATLETAWATDTNWASPATVPTSGETLIFGFSDVVTPTADLGTSDRTLGGLVFAAATPMLIQSSQNDSVTTLPATLTLNGGATTSVAVDGNTHAISAPLVLGSATTVALNTLTSSLTFSGPVSGAAITKTGTGTLILNAANTYAGAGVNTILSGGTLVAVTPASLPDYALGGEVTVASGATLAIRADATAATWQSADIDALFAVSPFVSGSKLGVEVPAAPFAYNTDIDGAQGLTKLGGGTFSLGGTSGYNGPTTVSAGTLHVAGTVYGTSSVTVTAAGALTVNGELSTTTLNTAGTTNLAADSTGTIATMNVTGGSTTVSAPTVMTLKPSAGTTTLGAAVTTLNVSGTALVNGAPGAKASTANLTGGTVDTQGNYLLIDTQLKVPTSPTQPIISMSNSNSETPFGIKSSNLGTMGTSISSIQLNGGTVTMNLSSLQTISVLNQSASAATSTTTSVSVPVTVATGSNVLAIEVSTYAASSTAGWTFTLGAQTFTQAVAQLSNNTTRVISSIFYLVNPDVGSGTISGTGLTGATAVTVDYVTLSGVNTGASPITAGADSSSGLTTSVNLSGITAGSIAIADQSFRNTQATGPYTFTGTGGTGVSLPTGTAGNVIGVGGYVQNLAGGTITVTGSAAANSSNRHPLAVAVFTPASLAPVINLPNADIVVTATSTLDLGGATTATLGSLSLPGTEALTLASATSVSFDQIIGASGSQLLASGLGLTLGSGNNAGSITADSVTKTSTGVLQLGGAQNYNTLTVDDGTLNVNGSLTTGTAAVTVTDTVGGAPTTLRFGSVSQTLSSLSIGAGATVVLTSDPATGAFSGGGEGDKADMVSEGLSLGGSAAVPEPGTFALLLVGALGGLARRHRVFTPAAPKRFSS